ncbi:MAG: hypothetical protein J0G30_10665 [Actinomycetales bacterium]|nr:hypothetical protein [Actinomycetales bacterium]
MPGSITLADAPALDDLLTLVARAARVDDGSVRMIAGGGVLAVYAAVLYPAGLLDETPTVLGLRTVAIEEREGFDLVAPLASLRARLERAQEAAARSNNPDLHRVTISLPPASPSVSWAAISPPRGGWYPIDPMDPSRLETVARAGIAEVAAALPEGTGEQLVRKVRAEVWGRPIEGAEHLPAGAAFAALSLGFLGPDPVELFETGPWTRLSTARGHVLVKRRAWTLSR